MKWDTGVKDKPTSAIHSENNAWTQNICKWYTCVIVDGMKWLEEVHNRKHTWTVADKGDRNRDRT